MSLRWRPISREGRAPIGGSWSAYAGFHLGTWAVGFGFDDVPLGFGLTIGPLFVGIEQDEASVESYDQARNWSRTLYRFVIQKWKLEIRLEFDLNLWKVGYVMADLHDHGIYLGPFNVQIEYDKFYNEPWPIPEPPARQIKQAFLRWLSEVGDRLSVPVNIEHQSYSWVRFSFAGIDPALHGMLMEGQELSVSIKWNDQHWDDLLSLDLRPEETADGWICKHCAPEDRKVFPNLDALARDHLFEPFMEWVNRDLAKADVVALSGSPSQGWTRAELKAGKEREGAGTITRIPVRV